MEFCGWVPGKYFYLFIFLQNCKVNSAINTHCLKPWDCPKCATLSLAEHQEKECREWGGGRHLCPHHDVLAIKMQHCLRCTSSSWWLWRVLSCSRTLLRIVEDQPPHNHKLSSDLSMCLKSAERSGSAWRSRGRKLVLVLMLKTELEQRFIFSLPKVHLDREIKEINEFSWSSISMLNSDTKGRINCLPC